MCSGNWQIFSSREHYHIGISSVHANGFTFFLAFPTRDHKTAQLLSLPLDNCKANLWFKDLDWIICNISSKHLTSDKKKKNFEWAIFLKFTNFSQVIIFQWPNCNSTMLQCRYDLQCQRQPHCSAKDKLTEWRTFSWIWSYFTPDLYIFY